jgi:hypothetical protein
MTFPTVLVISLILSIGARAAVAAEAKTESAGEPPKELLENLEFFEAMDFFKDPKVFDLVSNDPALADHISSGEAGPPAEAPSEKEEENQSRENVHENP